MISLSPYDVKNYKTLLARRMLLFGRASVGGQRPTSLRMALINQQGRDEKSRRAGERLTCPEKTTHENIHSTKQPETYHLPLLAGLPSAVRYLTVDILDGVV